MTFIEGNTHTPLDRPYPAPADGPTVSSCLQPVELNAHAEKRREGHRTFSPDAELPKTPHTEVSREPAADTARSLGAPVLANAVRPGPEGRSAGSSASGGQEQHDAGAERPAAASDAGEPPDRPLPPTARGGEDDGDEGRREQGKDMRGDKASARRVPENFGYDAKGSNMGHRERFAGNDEQVQVQVRVMGDRTLDPPEGSRLAGSITGRRVVTDVGLKDADGKLVAGEYTRTEYPYDSSNDTARERADVARTRAADIAPDAAAQGVDALSRRVEALGARQAPPEVADRESVATTGEGESGSPYQMPDNFAATPETVQGGGRRGHIWKGDDGVTQVTVRVMDNRNLLPLEGSNQGSIRGRRVESDVLFRDDTGKLIAGEYTKTEYPCNSSDAGVKNFADRTITKPNEAMIRGIAEERVVALAEKLQFQVEQPQECTGEQAETQHVREDHPSLEGQELPVHGGGHEESDPARTAEGIRVADRTEVTDRPHETETSPVKMKFTFDEIKNGTYYIEELPPGSVVSLKNHELHDFENWVAKQVQPNVSEAQTQRWNSRDKTLELIRPQRFHGSLTEVTVGRVAEPYAKLRSAYDDGWEFTRKGGTPRRASTEDARRLVETGRYAGFVIRAVAKSVRGPATNLEAMAWYYPVSHQGKLGKNEDAAGRVTRRIVTVPRVADPLAHERNAQASAQNAHEVEFEGHRHPIISTMRD